MRYYVITQRPANGGEDCPPFVYANKTEIIICCGKYNIVTPSLCMSGKTSLVRHNAHLSIVTLAEYLKSD